MPITFQCACGKTMRTADQFIGKTVRCPGCQTALTVPSESTMEDEPKPVSDGSASRAAEQGEERPAKRPSHDDDDDDRPRKKPVRSAADEEGDEDDDRPQKKRSRADEDDEDRDEDRPRKKPVRAEDDDEDRDEDRPRKKPSRAEDDDEDRPRKKRSANDDDDRDADDDRPSKKGKKSNTAGTSGKAITSLILALAACCLPVLGQLLSVVFGFLALRDIAANPRLGGKVLAWLGIGFSGFLFVSQLIGGYFAYQQFMGVKQGIANVHASGNLKSITLAMHEHEGKRTYLPPPAITDATGKPLLSWRVALLPYLGAEGVRLYSQFKLDEAWDGPTNSKLLDKMPMVYQSGGKANETHFRVFTGPGTMFEPTTAVITPSMPIRPQKAIRVMDATDGSSNTMLIIQADNAVPWTKPDELVFTPGAPMPKVTGNGTGKVLIATADGSVHMVDTKKLDDRVLRGLVTRNGNEAFPSPW